MDTKRFEKWLKVSKDSINNEPARVGQAVYNILQKPQEEVLVQDIIEEYQKKYVSEIEQAIKTHRYKLESPFFIIVLNKKEFWADNVLRNWFVTRQTRPSAKVMRNDYPNYNQTVYSYNKDTDEIKLLWTLPTHQDCMTIKKNRQLYDPQLLRWIDDFESGALDREV